MVSPWHDIPLQAGVLEKEPVFNFVVTIPKASKANIILSTTEPWNPMKQEFFDMELRQFSTEAFYTFGYFPQTWGSPEYTYPNMARKGHNGPLYVTDFGSDKTVLGQLLHVKVLGALPYYDKDILHWKFIVLNIKDPKAYVITNLDELKLQKPDCFKRIYKWFKRIYILPYKKKRKVHWESCDNMIKLIATKEQALQILADTHDMWKDLLSVDTKVPKTIRNGLSLYSKLYPHNNKDGNDSIAIPDNVKENQYSKGSNIKTSNVKTT